jgi:hypothetical protein
MFSRRNRAQAYRNFIKIAGQRRPVPSELGFLYRGYEKELSFHSNSYAGPSIFQGTIPQSKEKCHGSIGTSLYSLIFPVAFFPRRQGQPRQLGRSGPARIMWRSIHQPRRRVKICNVRERQSPAGRYHGSGRSRARHERSPTTAISNGRHERSDAPRSLADAGGSFVQ